MGAGSFTRRFSGAFAASFPWCQVGRCTIVVSFQVVFSAFQIGIAVGLNCCRVNCANAFARLISHLINGNLYGLVHFRRDLYVIRRSLFGFGSEFINDVRLNVVVIFLPVVPILPCVVSQAKDRVNVQSVFLSFGYMLYTPLRIEGAACR